MTASNTTRRTGGILVTDFDGTMTTFDFYKLATELLLPPDVPDYWAQYRAGQLTHFEGLQAYFAAIREPEELVLEVVQRMSLDPGVPTAVENLKQAGWRVVVTSAGCDWYIRKLLGSVDVELHANPGRFETGQGLLMEMPRKSPYWSPTLGVNKAAVVQHYLDQNQTVAFAGDGFPDVEPAKLVSDDLRFARADLADSLTEQGYSFRPFRTWSTVAETLLKTT